MLYILFLFYGILKINAHIHINKFGFFVTFVFPISYMCVQILLCPVGPVKNTTICVVMLIMCSCFKGQFSLNTETEILNWAQLIFAEKMQVSVLRVVGVKMTYDDTSIFIQATLLDTTEVSGKLLYYIGLKFYISMYQHRRIPQHSSTGICRHFILRFFGCVKGRCQCSFMLSQVVCKTLTKSTQNML